MGYGILNAQCTNHNQILLGNTAIGHIRAQVASITAYSDARFKTNVSEDVKGLDFITRLKPVTYNENPEVLHHIWGTPDSVLSKMDHTGIKSQRFIGFLAQDVEQAAKDCGFEFPGLDVPQTDKEVYALRYVDFIMPMVKSIQEQQIIIDALKNQNHDLQMKMDKLSYLEAEVRELKLLLSKQ
ncbi:MAG: tail fiber domain-containing protein [Saprospiraceae bacterium]|nr:tail fiber domain-containing protein [Saprospiraceae bacterium]